MPHPGVPAGDGWLITVRVEDDRPLSLRPGDAVAIGPPTGKAQSVIHDQPQAVQRSQVEDDVRILVGAKEIESDKARYRQALKCAREMLKTRKQTPAEAATGAGEGSSGNGRDHTDSGLTPSPGEDVDNGTGHTG